MRSLEVEGGAKIQGEVTVCGNKNAALPMIAASLLTSEPVTLHNVPDILDVRTMLDIARSLGAEADFQDHTLRICCPKVKTDTISPDLCRRARTSILFAAPLLVRTGRAVLSPPGGDVIGRRRLDGHFYGLEKLGGTMKFDGHYRFSAKGRLTGSEMFLDEASVTATEQILIAAATASGHTTLYNAAGEPHVVDLANLLNAMGANISGHGSNVIEIEGVESLHGVEYTVQGDYIEAGSFLTMAAVCGGGLVLNGTGPCRNYWMIRRTFERLGIFMDLQPDRIEIQPGQDLAVRNDFGNQLPTIADGPWPQFPSDMMSCTIVAATQAAGSVLFFEKMFESRIYFVDRLISMGAQAVVCDPHRVLISGKAHLHAVEMSSPDIRAGMAMVIAALCARGTSRIHQADMIYRGYENLVEKLSSIGVKIKELN